MYFRILIEILCTLILERITIDSTIYRSKPTIRGLRYPVENMLELMVSGMTIEELLEDYPVRILRRVISEGPSMFNNIFHGDCRVTIKAVF